MVEPNPRVPSCANQNVWLVMFQDSNEICVVIPGGFTSVETKNDQRQRSGEQTEMWANCCDFFLLKVLEIAFGALL